MTGTWDSIPDEIDALVQDYTAIPKRDGGVAMSNVAGYVIDKMRDCAAKGHAWHDEATRLQAELDEQTRKRQEAEAELLRWYHSMLSLDVPLPDVFRPLLDGEALARARVEHEHLLQYARDWHAHADRLVEQRDSSRHAVDRLMQFEFRAALEQMTDDKTATKIVQLIRDTVADRRDETSPNL